MKTRSILLALLFAASVTNVHSQAKYFKAIEKDNLKAFTKEIEKGSDVNYQKGKEGYTPLILASKEGKTEFVKILLDNNANIELKDNSGNTALIQAIANNHLDIANNLATHGAKFDVKNESGLSAIHFACLVDNNNDDEKRAEQMKLIDEIISSGISVNSLSNKGLSPLIFAAVNGNLEVVKYLTDLGADIHQRSEAGATAIGQAANKGHIDVVDFLLVNGADINVKCQSACTPLILAIQNKKYNVAEMLMELNANYKYVTPTGFSALKASVVVSHVGLVDTLVRKLNVILNLDTEYDNEIMASSIVYSNTNDVYAILIYREKYYALAQESKHLADSLTLDTEEGREHMAKYVENMEKSLAGFERREKEYRLRADKISAMNALKVIAGLALGVGMIDPATMWVVSPSKLKNPELLYKIADKYKSHMLFLQGSANMGMNQLQQFQ